MGDVEQVMAEPDEGEFVEDVDGLHPATLNQQNPWIVTQAVTSVVTLITSNGWYAMGFALLAYVIWVKTQPRVTTWRKKREEDQESAAYHKDPDKFLARETAIDKARLRMQESYNQSAVQWEAKQKELEEKKRLEKIEDWERHERGEGYRNKSKVAATASPSVPAASTASAASTSESEEKKKSGKPKLRPEYNPMTGDVGGGPCRWRPDRRGASGGG